MKTKIAICALATALSTPAFADARESGSRPAAMAVQIRYISIGAGIDGEAAAQINQILDGEKFMHKLEYVKESGWGMEGESTVCAQFLDFSDAYRVEQKIQTVVSASPKARLTEVKRILSCDPHHQPAPNQ